MSGITKENIDQFKNSIAALKQFCDADENQTVLMGGKRVPSIAMAAKLARNKGTSAAAVEAGEMVADTDESKLTPAEVSDFVDGLNASGIKRVLKHLILKSLQND